MIISSSFFWFLRKFKFFFIWQHLSEICILMRSSLISAWTLFTTAKKKKADLESFNIAVNFRILRFIITVCPKKWPNANHSTFFRFVLHKWRSILSRTSNQIWNFACYIKTSRQTSPKIAPIINNRRVKSVSKCMGKRSWLELLKIQLSFYNVFQRRAKTNWRWLRWL